MFSEWGEGMKQVDVLCDVYSANAIMTATTTPNPGMKCEASHNSSRS